ncbi:helix-turn-helix domain-containing protein [Fontibacillus sp. BL9]|uniref:helix-turn-helix domain-containing protein n=1 Tax=Fontibacillus sp. BL9 TaxID=3389971 RepID=UPI003977E4BE
MSGNNFGEFLKDLRKRHGYKTQKQLADISGISQTTLSRIEAGIQRPQPETLRILAEHLRPYTYGELMEHAGYLEGLNAADKDFVLGLFDESEMDELDHQISKIIDSISDDGKFNDTVLTYLETELGPLLKGESWADFEFTPYEIKQLAREMNIENKNFICNALKRVVNLSNNQFHDTLSEKDILTLAAHQVGHNGPLTEDQIAQIKLAMKIALAKDDK